MPHPTVIIEPVSPICRLILYCRAGFEGECAAEITRVATDSQLPGYCKAKTGSGVVFYELQEACSVELASAIKLEELIYTRQLVFGSFFLNQLSVTDRLQVVVPAIKQVGTTFGDLRLETADTNDAKELSVFCRKFAAPLRLALLKAGVVTDAANAANLHLFLLSSTAIHLGLSLPSNASPWLMGIPRLRFPAGAPSRSTLKLEEALLTFLSDQERSTLLGPGMNAVDLGAAPGGWTWQLVKRGLRVAAVDNGPMDAVLLESGLVTHCREDGFRYRPAKPVEWLVCDMVEQPSRIADLVARWLAEGLCRNAIFNLKLPMKKRYEEVLRCRAIITEAASQARLAGRLRFKQLYHDREEITGAWLAR